MDTCYLENNDDYLYYSNNWYKINEHGIYIPKRDEKEVIREISYSDKKSKWSKDELSKHPITMSDKLRYRDRFAKDFKTNNELVVFRNGVYDIKSKTFRDAKQSEYVYFNIPFYHEYKVPSASVVKDLENIVSNIFPDSTYRSYVLHTMAHCLFGDMCRKLYVFLGDGTNGKTIFSKLIQKTFVNLTIKFDIYLSNKKKFADVYYRILECLGNKRMLFSYKIESNEYINTNILYKMLRDKIEFYSYTGASKVSYSNRLNIVIESNQQLKFDRKIDQHRIEYIKFTNTFVHDDTILNKIKDYEYISAFCNLLCSYYDKDIDCKKTDFDNLKDTDYETLYYENLTVEI